MIDIIPAKTQNHFQELGRLADIIWREYYIPMVGKPQIDYMLEKFQSVEAIKNQVEAGFEYFLITFDTIPVSYIAIKKEEDTLFLSKIYVLSTYRGKKIGKKAMQFIEEKAKSYDLKAIRLTVNINNTKAINAYEAMGFTKTGTLKAPIGEGFFMDDFLMEKAV
ncbi:GNAT family N-acetyltransferase [Mariniflexile sp.]|uniref:GNAT family N-acetyltransferase n=1 Tax=Mariniflexile sp. TaxID=1979402 RepID=UPI003561FA49